MKTLKNTLISAFMMLYCVNTISAQNAQCVLPLKIGDKVIHENICNINLVESVLNNQCFDGKSYVLLQFYQLPEYGY